MTVALSSLPEWPSLSFGSHPTLAAMGAKRLVASLEKCACIASSAFSICENKNKKAATA